MAPRRHITHLNREDQQLFPLSKSGHMKEKDLATVTAFRENTIKGPQYINITDYLLTVTGLTNRTDVDPYIDVLEQYPHYTKLVTLFCVDDWDATNLWEGMQVRDLIRHTGPDPRVNTMIFTAHNGYTTSFPLIYLVDQDIIMAYKMNKVAMPVE